ncbi:hypothetical protein, partial [Burkholderia arboris]|uniref:hypothetical protein n=1 Tax=Burkholderia arboris TaxID=488730 RepID=UPI001CF41027
CFFVQSMPRASKQQARYAVGRCLMLWSSNDVTQQGSRPKTKLGLGGNMAAICSADGIYGEIASLMKELYDQGQLSEESSTRLVAALDKYWDIECDSECSMPYCKFQKPSDWIEYMGYTSLADLICRYDYESGIQPIKQRRSIDPLKASWARRPGHYSP